MTLEVEAARGEPARNRLRLLGFVALMLGSGLALDALAGGPRFPDRVPSPEQITGLLSHASLPPDGVAYVLASAAWLLWLWVFSSLAIELGLVALEAAAHGATWVARVRGVTHLFTLPLARRMVAAAFAVQVLTRAMPVAAAPLPIAEQVLALEPEDRADIVEPQRAGFSTYRVRPGDTLWTIAAQFYGSGDEYRQLVEANVGRRMSDGALFTPQGIIQPGWVLEVPGPTAFIEQEGDARWYTVRPGDTLSTVAARTLGDRDRWAEVFELNRDTARLPNGPALDDPDLIWPGLRLRLPNEVPPTSAQPADSHVDDLDVVLLTAAFAPPEVAPTPTLPAAPQAAEPATSGSTEPHSSEDDALDPSLPPLVRDVHPLVRLPADQSDSDVQPVADELPTVTAPTQSDIDAQMPQSPIDASQVPVNAALGALGAAAAAGLATLGVTRLRRWRPLPSEPESEVKVDGGYAEAPLEGELARRLGGGGQVNGATALVSQFLKIVDEYNLAEVQPLFVRHGRSSTTLTLAAGLAEQAILLDLAPVFAERLQVDCSAWVSIDQDVHACLTPLRKTRALQPADVSRGPAPWFVPIGVLFDRQLFSANWSALGHLLVVSLPGHGAQTILTSLLAETTARHSPEELRLWLVDRGRGLPPAMTELPHLDTIVDPDVDTALSGLVARLRAELEQRAEGGTWPELAIVVPELTCLGDAAAELQLLAGGASRIGVRLIAASSDPAAATLSPLLPSFTTKMVLHLEEEEHSVALLGCADAAFLGGGGRLLVRVEEREPIELYGYQVAPEHLERLVKVMRTAFSSSATLSLDVAAVGGATDAHEPVTSGDDDAESDLDAEIEFYNHLPDPPLSSSEVASAEIDAKESTATQAPDAESATTDAPVADQPTSELISSTTAPSDPGQVRLLVTPTAPIHVVCFGEPRVLCGGQQVWPRPNGGGDHKPWEVLLYLACQSVEGCTREALGQSLWPDDDGDRDVTHRMRQARYRIRSAFSSAAGESTEDGIALERNGAFYLDHNVVYSDAQEFLELTRLARIFAGQQIVIPYLERARAVYTADLLSGPGVRRYAWVDDRDESGVTLREHFRHKLQHAVLTLAELYEDAGEVERAADMYRELIDLEPTDERVWRALWRMGGTYKDALSLRQDEHRLRTILRDMALADGDDPLGDAAEPRAATRRDFERLLVELEALNAAGTPT